MNLIELLIEERLIRKEGDRYFSRCAMNEEITLELNNIVAKTGD